MGQMERRMILPARVLNEDNDFITLEVGKHEGVTFHLQQNEEGETVGGDRFHTIVFCRYDKEEQSMYFWLPWEENE